MATTIMDRINQLSAERSTLYRLAANGHRADPNVRLRVAQVSRELDALWERRRQERAGRREGIDLLVDRAYERLYGPGFADAVAPPHVSEGEDEALTLAA